MRHEPRFSRAAINRAIEQVAYIHNIDTKTLLGPCRFKHVVYARWELWDLMHKLGAPYMEISRVTNHDHSTVIYGIKHFRKGAIPYAKGNTQ